MLSQKAKQVTLHLKGKDASAAMRIGVPGICISIRTFRPSPSPSFNQRRVIKMLSRKAKQVTFHLKGKGASAATRIGSVRKGTNLAMPRRVKPQHFPLPKKRANHELSRKAKQVTFHLKGKGVSVARRIGSMRKLMNSC